MKAPTIFITLTLILLVNISISCSSSSSSSSSAHNFLECLSQKFDNVIYTPTNSSYSSILRFSLQNLRFASNSTPKPLVIITPEHESQIPPIIYCSKATALQIRTRSGGHDFEGLSYTSQVPFVLVDLINFSDITVDAVTKTAWVEAGATIGSLCYRIAEKTPILGFPVGLCPTVGVGGHFSGGGNGAMARKYGLAADNVIDARIIDVNGRFLNRKSMGEDLFWAIRGGGGASFGVIVAWKVQLVDVPERVTVFTVERTLEENATKLVHRWQSIAPKLSKDLYIGIVITRRNTTISVSFSSLFLGGIDRLLLLMQTSFPELGLVRENCAQVRWIQSVVYLAGFPIESSPQLLLNRSNPINGISFKAKSNYVQEPIPESGFEGIWRKLYESAGAKARIQMSPYGGRMAEIPKSAIPFPHRAGNLYEILQFVIWQKDESQNSDEYIRWSRRLHAYLAPYVSRGAYLNARDLDLGVNNIYGNTSLAEASIWGNRYFSHNFHRLVRVKTAVDPNNFFTNEQSIPPLVHFRPEG
ncbi:hypothetical protein C2S52_016625 [Perilla frutescens var. hirtella]|nr:hypothetical protein C2S52_016625 [Perilla frutescens var. hirtella]